MSSPRRAVFLDRDGVLVSDGTGSSVGDPSLCPGAVAAVRHLNDAGWVVIVVTNQPNVARGSITEDDVLAFHEMVGRELALGGARVDAYYHCPHHPDGKVARYRVECDCRKPLPGMLLRAAEDTGVVLSGSVMVGDRMTDIEAGIRAGCALTVLVESEPTSSPES